MSEALRSPEKLLESEMARYHYAGDSLIEILHAAQRLYGFLSHPLLEEIARKLRLPPSKVLGVATFYHLFRFQPVSPHTASVCLGTACYVEGAELLADVVKRKGWALQTVRCSGCCGLAPLAVLYDKDRDGEPLTRVTPEQLEKRLENVNDPGNPPRSSAN
jgi:bidirectional [NiFe] hydrogenase diaphorase subunit